MKSGRGAGQHGGDKHGAGNKGSGQRQNFLRLGYETGNNPFYLRVPKEPYYKGHQYGTIMLSLFQFLFICLFITVSEGNILQYLYPDYRLLLTQEDWTAQNP